MLRGLRVHVLQQVAAALLEAEGGVLVISTIMIILQNTNGNTNHALPSNRNNSASKE